MNVHRLIWATALSLLLVWPSAIIAEPLRVTDFASLGAFPTTPGSYVFDTSGTPKLTGPGGTNITGILAGDIAVFTFDGINVGQGFTLAATGSRPMALLSYSNVTISGAINVSGGGKSGGSGGGVGGAGGILLESRFPPFITLIIPPQPGQGPGGGGSSGGGGFGGAGAGVFGGMSYGDLALALQGGSGGGGGAAMGVRMANGGVGGGGGGGLEIGAISDIVISGSIFANGGIGSSGNQESAGGGGGSGGGILLHGESLILDGHLSVKGGSAAGFGGGGGRILILTDPDGFINNGTIDVAGGASAGTFPPGSPGQVMIGTRQGIIPEPASLFLMGVGALVLVSYRGRRLLRMSRSPI